MALTKVATGSILAALGVPAILTEPAGTFAIWVAPAMIFELLYSVVTNYLYAQGIVGTDATIQLLGIPVASVMLYLAIFQYDAGVYGVAIVWSVKRVLKL